MSYTLENETNSLEKSEVKMQNTKPLKYNMIYEKVKLDVEKKRNWLIGHHSQFWQILDLQLFDINNVT